LLVRQPYNASDVDIDQGVIAATSLLAGIALADPGLDTAAQPAAIVPVAGYGRHGRLRGDQLFAYGSPGCDSGFSVYNVSDPGAPAFVAGWSICAAVNDVETMTGGVALALADSGIWVYATPITDSTQPSARSPLPGSWRQLHWQDGYLWSLAPGGTLVRWQWNGATLAEIDRFEVSGAQRFSVWANRLAVSDSATSISVYRWHAGGSVTLMESHPTRNLPGSICVVADTTWVVDRDAVLRIQLATSAAVGDDERPFLPRTHLLQAPFPNPFNGAVQLTLHAQPGSWQVVVFDLLGRQVATWQGRALQVGAIDLFWHPDGAAGGRAGSGLYLVRAQNAGISECRKVIYLK
jgi:hypothetical protein